MPIWRQPPQIPARPAKLPITSGWANITKVIGVASAAIAKVNGVVVAVISKIKGTAV